MNQQKRGFTLVEMLVAIAIAILLSSLLSGLFSTYLKRTSLSSGASIVRSFLSDARSLSLSSKDSSSYGIYFASSTVTLFKGTTYSSGDSNNRSVSLGSYIVVQGLSLTGGATQIVFDRLKGSADKAGTVTLALATDPTQKVIITIYSTGIVE
jgi:prepilin-type N-terminal cleavage/methylation domain-containing protein